MRSMKKLGTVVAAASMLMAIGAGSASAASWDPPNTTLAATGTLILDAGITSVTCTYHSGVRSAGGADAFTTTPTGSTPAPPTFDHCTGAGIPGLTVTSVVADAPWTFTATSTTAIDVTNGNATITVDSFLGDCKITASAVSLAATWSNASHTATPGTGTFPITETGACPGDTTARMTGSVVVSGASIT
jgi:hypothetical protein